MRFLIVRLGALGDIVHAVPVAVALRRAFPDARIDWVVSAKHREILDLVPVVDTRIVIDDGRGAPGGMSLPAAIAQLRRTHYDVALDLQGLMKSAVIARLSGARRIVGFARRFARESAASLFYSDRYDPGGPGALDPADTRHVVALNLGMLTMLGVTPEAPEFRLEAPRSAAVTEALAAVGEPFVLLNVGAAWPNKRWPAARFARLAVELRARRGLRSLVLWGPGERALAEEAVAASGGTAQLAPATAIADIAAFAAAAAVMVSGDTGPTHIASAMGTPLVGIYGPTRPERNGPLGKDDVSVSRASICQCHHLRQCKLERMCLLDIDVTEVLDAVERRLDAAERHRG